MSADDQDLFGTMIKVENKDIFVDLKQNSSGMYLKLSERNGKARNTVLIPASGVGKLKSILDDVLAISGKTTKISSERKMRMAADPDVTARSVYVSGLAWETGDEKLLEHFSSAGKVVNAVVLHRNRGGRSISLGCGVVEFETSDEALNAIQTLNDSELDGRTIACREDRSVEDTAAPVASMKGKPKARPDASARVLEPNKVFVTALSWDTTSEDLTNFFSSVGDVINAEVLMSRKGRSLGHAVVEFGEPEFALEAIERLNNQDLDGRTIIVREYYQS